MRKLFCVIFILGFQLIAYQIGVAGNLTNVYIHPDFKRLKIYDIGILPFKDKTDPKRKDIGSLITAQFISQLNKKGWYSIHNLKEEDLDFPERLSKIDAILKAEILEYQERRPLKFGIKLSLIYLDTNETIWSLQEIFDANQKKVVHQIKGYYRDNIEKTFPLTGHKLYLVSIDKFLEFVFDTIIETLK